MSYSQKAVAISKDGNYSIITINCLVVDTAAYGGMIQYTRSFFDDNGNKYLLDRYDHDRDTVYYREFTGIDIKHRKGKGNQDG